MTTGSSAPNHIETQQTGRRRAMAGWVVRSLLLIILAFILAIAPTTADQRKARLASDLIETVKGHSPYDLVRVVVNVAGDKFQEIGDRVVRAGGRVLGAYKKSGQIVAELPGGALEELSQVDGFEYATPDRPIGGLSSHIQITTGASLVSTGVLPVGGVLDGSGLTAVVIDSGIDTEESDLRTSGARRVLLSMDFTGAGLSDDPYGHGTHVAGIIAASGASSIKVGSDFTGIAPNANLLSFRVLDGQGRGYLSKVVAAIDLAISTRATYNTRVINISLAAPPIDSYRDDPLCKATDRAVQAGLVVVASAGNFGVDPSGNKVYGGITSPGLCPSVITVGATRTLNTDIRSDDTVAPFSSRGPTRSHGIDPSTGAIVYDNLAKPDLVAPGTRLVSVQRYQNTIVTAHPELNVYLGPNVNNKSLYMIMSGTSMSAPVVSGAVLLMLQANPSLTPNMVKAILMYTTQIMEGPDLFEQGAGMLNIDGAVRVANSLSRQASSVPVGSRLTYQLPVSQSTIALQPFVWSQSLIWGGASLSGSALLTRQQDAYAQTLIWGFRDASAWGSGVTYSSGLYGDGYVVFGKNGQWSNISWTSGVLTSSGCTTRDVQYVSGAVWQNSLMPDAFYTLNSSSLIWGFDTSLIWGFDSSLIWGFNSSLIWSF